MKKLNRHYCEIQESALYLKIKSISRISIIDAWDLFNPLALKAGLIERQPWIYGDGRGACVKKVYLKLLDNL
jgi:hypothetical protein